MKPINLELRVQRMNDLFSESFFDLDEQRHKAALYDLLTPTRQVFHNLGIEVNLKSAHGRSASTCHSTSTPQAK